MLHLDCLILRVSEILFERPKRILNNIRLKIDQLDHALHDLHVECRQRYAMDRVGRDRSRGLRALL